MKSTTLDAFNFASKLTPYRAWNAFKVLCSYYYSRLKKQPIQWGLPFNISIEPTTTCNLKCPECPSGLRSFTRPTGNMSEGAFDALLHDLGKELLYLYFYFQGEPFLHPRFLDFVRKAADRKIYTVTSTNAHYLTPAKAEQTVKSGLDRIIISIDGITQETYESYRRGGKLQKVIDGTKNLIEAKERLGSATPYVIFQFLVVRPNEHEIPDVKKLGRELGVDEVKLKTAQVYDFEKGNPLIPTIDKYARYKEQPDGSWKIKNNLSNYCWKLWHSCVITWDGKVVPCCFDKDAENQLGQLNGTRFNDIWKDEPYGQFRSRIMKSRSEIPICTNCTEGTKVWK